MLRMTLKWYPIITIVDITTYFYTVSKGYLYIEQVLLYKPRTYIDITYN